ncbi:membrane protein [Actinoplanes sp. SE50]|uniref:DUF456 domain-containing protein n=1 Tax=unclassified Actinoplanes TaxID=2626549 RepID=UPI00023EC364|nr:MULTISPECIES: DUF456 family protein [unclassified Actinoplanes]AEV87542.1 hypothetical protein ACPL_6660 [Actinoplanes sp. SE50/110]ATO85945.1 membrane protein [Actinoplanes sp. SE50]SLM03359.1 membrane protein [Actinoplanes sp. SE50/110]
MDLSDSAAGINLITGLLVAGGVLGVFLPVIPGLLLSWAGVLLWVLLTPTDSDLKWAMLAIATGITALAMVIKFLWPARKLRDSGVRSSSLLAGGVLGVVGFFVVPVVGLVLGFLLGVYLVEASRLGGTAAWRTTRRALAAVGLSLLVELAAALCLAVIWFVGVVATAS